MGDSNCILGKTQKFAAKQVGQQEHGCPFPHCDSRVLHAPGECEYCDSYPHYQELRKAWGINFTGEHEKYSYVIDRTQEPYKSMPPKQVEACQRMYLKLPCPAEVARPLETVNKWHGNTPMTAERKAAEEGYWQELNAAFQANAMQGEEPDE